ncbi:ABC transporter permease [Limnochorda pilosa]|uniref:ABC transporter permease n=1 Tax=Limnochorda pilosa TaxID=1555112 RepID=A0A0K2SH72_LIMPI|nr:FtsX-like permease family protein [Limnochorda pilosa]BAS26471.1 ABC transporter permease [Limnochorda pilosa]
MGLFRIALRNLGRSPSRTALGIASAAAAVLVVVLMKGMVTGIIQGMEENTIRLGSGHVRIIDREYRVRERLLSLQYPVDGFTGEGLAPMTDALKEIPEVEEVVPRLRFGAMISRGEDLRGVQVVGGDPDVERRVLRVDRYLGEGRYVRAGAREAVLGRRLLDRLDLSVGDRFTLVFNTALGALRGYTFTVVGAFESGLAYLDDGTVFVPLDVAQAAVDLGSAATEILLMARNQREVPAMMEEVQSLVESRGAGDRYTAIPWYEHSDIVEWSQVGRRIYDIIYFGILFLASFVVINTFVMIVNERRREIGMLSALGLRPREIRTLFLLEGGLSGLAGSLIGAGVGTALLAVWSRVGILVPGVEALDAEWMYPARLYPVLDVGVVGFAFAAGLLVMVLASYYPARRAARLEPTEALRG